jgi:hypothetical protein
VLSFQFLVKVPRFPGFKVSSEKQKIFTCYGRLFLLFFTLDSSPP